MTVAVTVSLQVFAREPVPGAVKTRLAATIGADAAAACYRELTAITLQHARDALESGAISSVELWCSPATDTPWFAACAKAAHASVHLQVGDDLGARMQHALAGGRARAHGVLLIGTDCPVLDVAALAAAAALLRDHDAVLQPAEDGGFVLVGSRVPLRFDGVRMSTPHTARDTMAVFVRDGIRCGLLPVAWDVDEHADLMRWQRVRACS